MTLALRVGDRIITRLAEDLSFSRGLHGDAACSFRYRAPIGRGLFDPYANVYLYDFTGETQYEGRMEDPGRSVDGDGQLWAATAVGEQARASDQTAPLIYIDTDLSRWLREQAGRAPSAGASAGELPSAEGTDALVMQFNPGQPIDGDSLIAMSYRAIQEADMEIGGIEYEVVDGIVSVNYENLMSAVNESGSINTTVRRDTYSMTPVARSATLTDATPLPSGTTSIRLSGARTSGGATTVGSAANWAGFYNMVIKAVRYNLDGTLDTVSGNYAQGRGVFAHEAVTDVLARYLSDAYDVPNADIDTTSTFEIDQLAYPDGITAAKLFEDLMALDPAYYWQVGPSNASGKPTFTWRKWPEHVRYEASMRDGLDLPGNDAERFNRVTVRWKDRRGRIKTQTYDAGTTISGTVVPTVPELDAAGLVRSPEIQDLADEIGSQADADKFAAEYLLDHGTPPAAGTLTVARKIWDNDKGRLIEPYEIMPGHLLRVRELATEAGDLSTTSRDGRCVFRVTGMEYRQESRAATVELDAPPKSDEVTLAVEVSKRSRKR